MDFDLALFLLPTFMVCVFSVLLLLGFVKLGVLLKIDVADKRFRYAAIFMGVVSAVLLFFSIEDKVVASLSVVILIIALFVLTSYRGNK
jgi:hypothetical protein